MAKYIINKEKCVGAAFCVTSCDGAAKMEEDGKAIIIDSEKMEKCGGEAICPYSAIEKIE